VEYVNFEANFNNGPMILALSKLGLRYGFSFVAKINRSLGVGRGEFVAIFVNRSR
jgi:hypothetical protein